MANLTIQTIESVNLNGKDIINNYTQTIQGINYIDNRNLNLISGSTTNVIYMSSYVGPGQFVTSSFQYGRMTSSIDPTFVMDQILTIVAQPSGSAAQIEYLVATT